jgi:hypothetical protein
MFTVFFNKFYEINLKQSQAKYMYRFECEGRNVALTEGFFVFLFGLTPE